MRNNEAKNSQILHFGPSGMLRRVIFATMYILIALSLLIIHFGIYSYSLLENMS